MPSLLQHYLNPLHIYCRLRDLGLSRWQAIKVCKFYERTFCKLLFPGRTLQQCNMNKGYDKLMRTGINIIQKDI
jgi:hypothetical protein